MNNRKKKRINVKPPAVAPSKKSWPVFIPVFILVAITAILFSGALKNDFTNWDDIDYVTENPYVRDLSFRGIGNIFTVYVSNHYHPLTLLSLAIDYHLWGLNATGYIAGNILLHLLNVVLVFFILRQLGLSMAGGFIGALIFAIHPMRIESVVWVSERKDVLYVFFYLLALINYMRFLTSDRSVRYYLYALILFIMALFSKASAVSLPLVLLAVDYYFERQDYKKSVLEKIPLFLFSLIFGLIAVQAQSGGAQNTFPLMDKVFMFTYALCFYLFRFIAPFRHTPLIEFPVKEGAALPVVYYVSALIIPVLIIIYFRLRSFRKVYLFSILFFVLSVFMVLVKYPVGPAYLAERYTYMPYIALSFLLVTLITKDTRGHLNRYALFFLVPWLVFMAYRTVVGIGVWKNSTRLWTHVINYNPASQIGYNNRGIYRDKQGDYAGAIADFSEVIKLDSLDDMAYYNRGLSRKNKGDYAGALADLNKTVVLKPLYDAYYYRGNVKGLLGDYKGAVSDFNSALYLKAGDTKALTGRGTAYMQLGESVLAITDFNNVLKTDPNSADALMARGTAYSMQKDFENALRDYDAALRITPGAPEIYLMKGIVLNDMGQRQEACKVWQNAAGLGSLEAADLLNEMCMGK